MWFRVILVALVVGAFVWAVARFSTASRLFVIRVKGGRALLRGKVPGLSASRVCRFVEELGLPEGAKISAERDGERFRLDFSPHVPVGEHQRLRNFLYMGI